MNDSNYTEQTSFCITNRSVFDYVKGTSFLVFGGLGILGNIFIIILAAKYTSRKNLHYLIINMAVSDILIAMLHIPEFTTISVPSKVPEIVSNVLCKSVNFFRNTAELLTLITLLIISIERYRATKLAIGTKSWSKLKLICIGWLVSMLLSFFNLIFVYAAKINPLVCSRDKETNAFNALYILKSISLVLMYLSVFVISVVTSVRLSKSNSIQCHLTDEQRRRRAKRMISAVRMVLCSLLLYSVCYLPEFIDDIIKSVDPTIADGLSENCQELLEFLLTIPIVINSSISPLIYLVFLEDFRRAAKNLILTQHTPPNDST